MNETLVVACRRCGWRFATPLQVDRATLEALVLDESYRCPRCSTAANYVKADHFHVLEIGDTTAGDG